MTSGLKGLSARAVLALETPPVEWDAMFNGIEKKTAQAIEMDLAVLAQRSVMLSRYLFYRWAGHNHSDAVKHCNRALTAVRKVLGYSRPKAGEINF